MKKLYKVLTEDQRKRGVMFSSSLSTEKVENGTVHEITHSDALEDPDSARRKKERLLDDSFFNRSPFKYNIVRV